MPQRGSSSGEFIGRHQPHQQPDRNHLCGICEGITVQTFLSKQFCHVHGYEILISSAEKCEFCNLMRDGIRKGFIANSRELFYPGDPLSIDAAIIASVLHGNPFSPGRPGWITFSNLAEDGSKFVVWASAKAWCIIEVFSLPRKYLIYKIEISRYYSIFFGGKFSVISHSCLPYAHYSLRG